MSLIREDYKNEYQSVDVLLTIVDASHVYSLCASKEIYFTPYINKETVFHVEKNYLYRGYCGLNRLRFVPSDILTVKCEITVYKIFEDECLNEYVLEQPLKFVEKEICWIVHKYAPISYVLLFFLLLILLQIMFAVAPIAFDLLLTLLETVIVPGLIVMLFFAFLLVQCSLIRNNLFSAIIAFIATCLTRGYVNSEFKDRKS